MNAASLAGPVIDLSEVPWTALTIGVAILWSLLEARLNKAGYVRQKAVDDIVTQLAACVRVADLDGLARRLEERVAVNTTELERQSRAWIMDRTDLDQTRDRVTRLEEQNRATLASLTRIETGIAGLTGKLSAVDRLEADVENLKHPRP
jgi:hypothetical protein